MIVAGMIDLQIKNLAGRSKFLTGATLGQKHEELITQSLLADSPKSDQLIVILDFNGIEFASASYFKATVLTLAKKIVSCPPYSEITFFPILRNLSDEHREELSLACRSERFPSLEVTKFAQKSLAVGRMYGEIENTFKRSLQFLQNSAPATAVKLAEQSPDEQINVTAWNNRLAELFRLRLATRFKEGRFWKYQPVIKEITYG
jgi:hypothetical protein